MLNTSIHEQIQAIFLTKCTLKLFPVLPDYSNSCDRQALHDNWKTSRKKPLPKRAPQNFPPITDQLHFFLQSVQYWERTSTVSFFSTSNLTYPWQTRGILPADVNCWPTTYRIPSNRVRCASNIWNGISKYYSGNNIVAVLSQIFWNCTSGSRSFIKASLCWWTVFKPPQS